MQNPLGDLESPWALPVFVGILEGWGMSSVLLTSLLATLLQG